MACLVAVAAPIGGGKTALVNGLALALGEASTVYFDHYELATRKSPGELARWIQNGADFNDLAAPGLLTALDALKQGERVIDPVSGASIAPAEFIVVEMPLGREYAETAHLIDILVWVDIPFDVALARNIKSLTMDALANREADQGEFLRWLQAYLEHYIEQVRPILLLQKQRVAATADIVLNGLLPPDAMVANALREIRECKPRAPRNA